MSSLELRTGVHTISHSNKLMNYFVEPILDDPIQIPNLPYFHNLGFDSVNGILTNEREIWWSRFTGDSARSHTFLAEAANVEEIGYLGQFEIHRGRKGRTFYQVYAYTIEDIERILEFSFKRSDYHPESGIEFGITPRV